MMTPVPNQKPIQPPLISITTNTPIQAPAPVPVVVSLAPPPKPWWQSKSLWNGVAVTALGLGTLGLTGKAGSYVSILGGIAAVYLRTQTSAPIAGTAAADAQGGVLPTYQP